MSGGGGREIRSPAARAADLRAYFDDLLVGEASQELLRSGSSSRGALGADGVHGTTGLAALGVAGLSELALVREVDHKVVAHVAEIVAGTKGRRDSLDIDLCRWALTSARLLSFPPSLALKAQLRLAKAGPPFREIALWQNGPEGPECVMCLGEEEPSAAVARAAQRAFAGTRSSSSKGPVHIGLVRRWGKLQAVVVACAARRDLDNRCRAVLEAAVEAVHPALEKEMLLRRNGERERMLVESTERRSIRLGLDLHDGPLQDVAALAEEVRLLRRQLRPALEDSEYEQILLGRMDDVEARLVGLDGELRDLARSFDAPSFASRPLRDVLEHEVALFKRRVDVPTSFEIRGDLGPLTVSQRIALVRIVQESLANVREHSGASEVKVSVVAGRGKVRASIWDNGRGFDVERALVRAAGHGRLGLVGMSERVRLLGGAFDIQSAPGGPTAIAVVLPEWQPLTGQAAELSTKRRA